jgi:mannose-6-phosphate isomerase
MYPLQFRPILKRLRWGGRRLGTLLGKSIGDGSDYAESWEIADLGADQTTVIGGSYQGWTLHHLVETHGPALLGLQSTADRFPLLVKFLDAHDRLSVQVHPNDEQARRLGCGSCGKTEAWVVLFAEPGACLYTGLKAGVDRAAFIRSLEAGRIEQCLHSYNVFPGDCVLVPAGTVHTIGEGVVLAEIQQTSDTTFRIDDWGRLGPDGKPRTLHIDEALQCIDFERGPVDPIVPQVHSNGEQRVEELVACPFFEMNRRTLASVWTFPEDERFRILMPVRGRIVVRSREWQHTVGLGDTLLVPACVTNVSVGPDPTSETHREDPTVLEIFVR